MARADVSAAAVDSAAGPDLPPPCDDALERVLTLLQTDANLCVRLRRDGAVAMNRVLLLLSSWSSSPGPPGRVRAGCREPLQRHPRL